MDEDYRVYIRRLKESAERCGLTVSAYRLMANHICLTATPARDKALSKTIGKSGDILDSLRLHYRTRHPLGDDAFLNQIKAKIGRDVSAIPQSLPKGNNDKIKRKRQTSLRPSGKNDQ